MFDFRLGGIDILPDFIGFILFYTGLEGLIQRNQHFAAARQYALPLIFLSLFDIYQVQRPEFNIDLPGGISLVIGLITTVLSLLMVYNLCTGIAEVARAQDNTRLQENALVKWNYYLIANLLYLFSFLFVAIIIPPLAVIVVLLAIVAFIVVPIMMMLLMKQANEELFNTE